MAGENLRPLERNGANFVFRDRRLLVGWLVWEKQRTEAWLGVITESQAAGEVQMGYERNWYRTYTSSDGQNQLRNGVMGVSEVHPAILEPHDKGSDEDFVNKGQESRLDYLIARYERAMNGRAKYCTHEGGELDFMKFDRPQPDPEAAQKVYSRKRKRSRHSSEDSEYGWSRKKGPEQCWDDDYDDDDDDDEEILIKKEPTDLDARDQTPAVPDNPTPFTKQHRSIQSQSHEQITTAVASLNLDNAARPGSNQPTDQKDDPAASLKPELIALNTLAHTLKDTLLDHIRKWASSTSGIKLVLPGSTGTLYMATEIGEIVSVSRDVLKHVNNYCEQVVRLRKTTEQNLEDAMATGLHVDTLRMHESLVREYEKKEKELGVVVEEMAHRIDGLQIALTKMGLDVSSKETSIGPQFQC